MKGIPVAVVKTEAGGFAHLHTVTVRHADGTSAVYRYHRRTRVRIFAEPGEPGFAEQYELAASGHKTAAGRRRIARRASPKRGEVYVYFVHAPDSGRVKIGRAADVRRRLAVLQTGSPEALRLLAATLDKSGGELERDFQRMFAADRLKGEWFKASEPLLRLALSYRR